jgi:hypothetical protein
MTTSAKYDSIYKIWDGSNADQVTDDTRLAVVNAARASGLSYQDVDAAYGLAPGATTKWVQQSTNVRPGSHAGWTARTGDELLITTAMGNRWITPEDPEYWDESIRARAANNSPYANAGGFGPYDDSRANALYKPGGQGWDGATGLATQRPVLGLLSGQSSTPAPAASAGAVAPGAYAPQSPGGLLSGSSPIFSNHGYSLPSFADPNTAGYNSPMARDQLAFMLNQDTPYMQAAHNAGLQRAAQRGLLNSSLASEAAQKAMVEAAGPIAQQDAQHLQGLREMAEKFGYDTRLDNNREAWATARTEYQSDQQLRADYLKSISNINAQDLNPEDKARAVENLAELYRQSTIRGVMDRISIGENGQISFIQGNTTITPESGSAGQNGGAATSWRNYDTRASMPADLRMQYEARYGTAYEPTQVRWMEGAANDIAHKLTAQGYPVLPPGSEGSVQSQYTGHVFTGANAWPARNAFDQEFQKRAQDVGLSLSNTAALQKVFGWQPPPPDAPYEGGN